MSYSEDNSGRQDSFQDGLEFQDFVTENMSRRHGIHIQCFSSKRYQYERGESVQGIEIKLDARCLGAEGTKRLSIEIAEKTDGENEDFVPSGIYGDSRLYLQGNERGVFLFITNFLRLLHQSGKYREDFHPRNKPTVKKFYLPLEDAHKYGEWFPFEEEE